MTSILDLQTADKVPPPIWEVFPGDVPDHPYCTDDLASGLLIRSRKTALGFAHIQFNDPARIRFLPFDIDSPDAYEAYERAQLPAPNVYIGNPENGHAHLAWALEQPVLTGENARQSPIRYAEAVERGFARRLGADPAYSGLIVKNPLHKRHRTLWLAPRPYALADLAAELTTEDKRFRPRDAADMGSIGRNVQVFDETRSIAYREVRSFKKNGGTLEQFRNRVERIAFGVNLQFASPLPPREIKASARSISKWIWSKFSDARFVAIQSQRGERSGAARAAHAEIVQAQILSFVLASRDASANSSGLLSDMVRGGASTTCKQIASALKTPQRTIERHLAALKARGAL